MIHGRARAREQGGEVLVSIDECFICRGRSRKERLLLGACVIFMFLAAAELLLLLCGGLYL